MSQSKNFSGQFLGRTDRRVPQSLLKSVEKRTILMCKCADDVDVPLAGSESTQAELVGPGIAIWENPGRAPDDTVDPSGNITFNHKQIQEILKCSPWSEQLLGSHAHGAHSQSGYTRGVHKRDAPYPACLSARKLSPRRSSQKDTIRCFFQPQRGSCDEGLA